MDINNFLAVLNDKLKSGDVEDVKKDSVVAEITNGNLKLLNIIESLGEVLVNEDKVIRERGVDYLSWILNEIPSNFLNDKEVTVVMNFYIDRLKDHHSIIPAVLRGLLGCVKMKSLMKESIVQMLTQLFQHVNCRTQLPEDRHNIFLLFQFIIKNYLDEVKIMGPDFVFGLISFADSETDPKNLLLLFEFLPIFLEKFELGHLTEEMFEILSCYFPIDFNTASRNNVIITREDLSSGLIKCLSTTRSFSEFCIPLAFEKLDSTLKTAKIDSYKLLQECFKIYKVEDVEKHLNELRKVIQKDVLPGMEKEIREEGLKTLSCLVKLLSLDSNNFDIFYDFLNDLLTTCKSFLSNVTDSLFIPAMNVLIASSSKSSLAVRHILKNLKPYYQKDFTKLASERKILLSSLLPFLNSEIFSPDILEESSELLDLFIDATSIQEWEVRKIAFVGLKNLAPFSSDLNRRKLYSVMVRAIKEENNVEARNECLNVFRILAEKFYSEVAEVVNSEFKAGEVNVNIYLDALAKIADLPHFTDSVISLILTVITDGSNFPVGLACLLSLCESTPPDFHIKINKDYEVIEKLLIWSLQDKNEENFKDDATVFIVSKVVAILVRSQTVEVQQSIVNKFQPKFLEILNERRINYRILISVLEAVLGSIRPSVIVPSSSDLTSNLTSLSLKVPEESVQISAFRLLASFVNKWPDKDARDLLERLNGEIFANLTAESDGIVKSSSAKLFNWIMKGIILRGSVLLDEWIPKWFHLLNREDVGNVIADGFSIVLDEDQFYLNLSSHCNIKVLYRQRLFTYFPKLVQMYQTSSENVKLNYLIALARLIQGLPKHIILTEISSVVILLIQSLQSDKPEILIPSLEILTDLLEDKEKVFADYIQSFVDRLLTLSKFDGYMKIRIHALKCIFFYAFYPTELLLPFKQKVVRELESCLDDKKRLVRNEAVKARSRWYLVGAPGEDDIFS